MQNCLFGKLLLECEDEILNATETLLNHKNWPVKKVIAFLTLFH